ncbi:MAG TPA: DUF2127 domain-containing protein [Candidatus Margulisiibacteriota bacterium]|nr:DUF2127 domain-containing protein [Candidatus Margulisiibacteriota bacterium]
MPVIEQGDIALRAPVSRSQDRGRASSAAGLRTVAVFEATKGALVLVAGFGLLALVHHDVQSVAEEVVQRFHLNLAHHHPRILTEAMTHLDDAHLRWLALAALLYSAVRFVEAYGLWRMRTWAEWFAIGSGGIYLPIEVYELFDRPTGVKAVVLLFNAGIVAYLIYVRWRHAGHSASAQGRHGPAFFQQPTAGHGSPPSSTPSTPAN